MHPSSYKLMGEFIKKYLPAKTTVLDVGGADVNGSYKPLIKANGCEYKTLDWQKADYIVNGYDWSRVPAFGAVISGQTLEHDMFFWRTLENMSKVCTGWAFIIVPSKGKYHAHPYDCYRFYKDADRAFAEIMGMKLVETRWNQNEYWGDLGIVLKK